MKTSLTSLASQEFKSFVSKQWNVWNFKNLGVPPLTTFLKSVKCKQEFIIFLTIWDAVKMHSNTSFHLSGYCSFGLK